MEKIIKGNANFSCLFKGLYHLEDYNFPMKQLPSTISSSLPKDTNSRGHNLSHEGSPLAFFSHSFFFSLQIFHLYSFKYFTYI